MRIHLATIGRGAGSTAILNRFETLAASDTVGRHQLAATSSEADLTLIVDVAQVEIGPLGEAVRSYIRSHNQPASVRVYDERDVSYLTAPGIYPGAKSRLVSRRLQMSAPYVRTLTKTEPLALGAATMLFTFRGSLTHPVRDQVMRLDHDRGEVVDIGEQSLFTVATAETAFRKDLREQYRNSLARAKFVLCPRGWGASSFRIFESLGAGRVPVIISDDWVAPELFPWETCSIRVAESEVASIPRLLERMEPRWPDLASAALRAHDEFLSEGRFWNYLNDLLAVTRRSRLPWWADRSIVRSAAREWGSSRINFVRPGLHMTWMEEDPDDD